MKEVRIFVAERRVVIAGEYVLAFFRYVYRWPCPCTRNANICRNVWEIGCGGVGASVARRFDTSRAFARTHTSAVLAVVDKRIARGESVFVATEPQKRRIFL